MTVLERGLLQEELTEIRWARNCYNHMIAVALPVSLLTPFIASSLIKECMKVSRKMTENPEGTVTRCDGEEGKSGGRGGRFGRMR